MNSFFREKEEKGRVAAQSPERKTMAEEIKAMINAMTAEWDG